MNANSINPITGKREQATVASIDSIDDLANTAPEVNTARRPTRRAGSYMTRAVAGLGMLLYATFAPQPANASLITDVDLEGDSSQKYSQTQPASGSTAPKLSDYSITPLSNNNNQGLDWDVTAFDSVGKHDSTNKPEQDVLRIIYSVMNYSKSVDANNLIQFQINAGSNHGIYNVEVPSNNWIAEIFDNTTKFSGSIIKPDSGKAFTIYSEILETTPGTASALSSGSPANPNIPFDPKDTIIPIPEPGTALLFLLGGGAYALLKRQRKEPEVPKLKQDYK